MSSDKKLVLKLTQRHGSNTAFMSYKNDSPRFGIKHFAVPVSGDPQGHKDFMAVTVHTCSFFAFLSVYPITCLIAFLLTSL